MSNLWQSACRLTGSLRRNGSGIPSEPPALRRQAQPLFELRAADLRHPRRREILDLTKERDAAILRRGHLPIELHRLRAELLEHVRCLILRPRVTADGCTAFTSFNPAARSFSA